MMADAILKLMEAAYLAGFNASGEGYNAELRDEGMDRPVDQDEYWCVQRAKALTAIAKEFKS